MITKTTTYRDVAILTAREDQVIAGSETENGAVLFVKRVDQSWHVVSVLQVATERCWTTGGGDGSAFIELGMRLEHAHNNNVAYDEELWPS